MKVDFAPIQINPLDDGGGFVQGWLQWVSSVGEALKGQWSSNSWALTLSGASAAPDQIHTIFRGKLLQTTIIWESGVIMSSATISFPFEDKDQLQFEDGMLHVWIGSTHQSGAVVSDGVIQIPDLSTGEKVTLEGTLILKEN